MQRHNQQLKDMQRNTGSHFVLRLRLLATKLYEGHLLSYQGAYFVIFTVLFPSEQKAWLGHMSQHIKIDRWINYYSELYSETSTVNAEAFQMLPIHLTWSFLYD